MYICVLRNYFMLTFESITPYEPGIISSLLSESYGELLSSGAQFWQGEKKNWIKFDAEVFDNPATVGQCVFLTRVNARIIGFSSFDPRHGALSGRIGHNCILPAFRGQGFGTYQLYETLRRLTMRSIRKAVATTSEHPFFIPAQRMYLSCGFRETKREDNHRQPEYRVIEYEKELI